MEDLTKIVGKLDQDIIGLSGCLDNGSSGDQESTIPMIYFWIPCMKKTRGAEVAPDQQCTRVSIEDVPHLIGSDSQQGLHGHQWGLPERHHTALTETCLCERRLPEECIDNRHVGILPCGSWPDHCKWRRGSPCGLDPTQGLNETRHRLGCVLPGSVEELAGLEVGDGPPGPSKTVASKEKKK